MHYAMLRWRTKGMNRERSGGLFQPKWFWTLKYRENKNNRADTNRQMISTLTYLNPTLNHCRLSLIIFESNFFLLCGCVNINKLQDGQARWQDRRSEYLQPRCQQLDRLNFQNQPLERQECTYISRLQSLPAEENVIVCSAHVCMTWF